MISTHTRGGRVCSMVKPFERRRRASGVCHHNIPRALQLSIEIEDRVQRCAIRTHLNISGHDVRETGPGQFQSDPRGESDTSDVHGNSAGVAAARRTDSQVHALAGGSCIVDCPNLLWGKGAAVDADFIQNAVYKSEVFRLAYGQRCIRVRDGVGVSGRSGRSAIDEHCVRTAPAHDSEVVPYADCRRERNQWKELGTECWTVDVEVQVPSTEGKEPLFPISGTLIVPNENVARMSDTATAGCGEVRP